MSIINLILEIRDDYFEQETPNFVCLIEGIIRISQDNKAVDAWFRRDYNTWNDEDYYQFIYSFIVAYSFKYGVTLQDNTEIVATQEEVFRQGIVLFHKIHAKSENL